MGVQQAFESVDEEWRQGDVAYRGKGFRRPEELVAVDFVQRSGVRRDVESGVSEVQVVAG